MPYGDHVVVVGGGLGGWQTAVELRAAGFAGRLTLLADEDYPPYDRPPLSKRLLKVDVDLTPEFLAHDYYSTEESLRVDLRCGVKATGLRPNAVFTDAGDEIGYDALVIATGVRARQLAGVASHPRVHTLRTFDDAVKLRAAMDTAHSLIVVGAGFIGAEVATVAHDRGLDVTMVEVLQVPHEPTLGALVGGILGRLATRYGVRLLTGRGVSSLGDDVEAVMVTLTDGSRLCADIAVVGVGSRVNTEWLGSAIPTAWETGITCDPAGRVHGLAPMFRHVYALGDVAAWYDETQGLHARFEHWTSAVDQAPVVARTLLADLSGEPKAAERPLLPYFWSDQFGRRVQLLGRPRLADRIEIFCGSEDPINLRASAPRNLLAGYFKDDSLVGVAGIGAPRLLLRYRRLIEQGASRAAIHAFTATLR